MGKINRESFKSNALNLNVFAIYDFDSILWLDTCK